MRYSREIRKQAREMWLSGRCVSVAEIARKLKLTSGTLCKWRRQDDWDGALKQLEEKATDRMADLYAERSKQLTDEYWTVWRSIFALLAKKVRDGGEALTLAEHDAITRVLERAQRGQGIAMAVDGGPEIDEMPQEIIVQFQSLKDAILAAREAGELVHGGADRGIRIASDRDGGHNGT